MRAVPVGDKAGEVTWVAECLVRLGPLLSDLAGRRSPPEPAGAALIVLDAEERIVSWSATATAILGFEVDEVLGRRAALVIPDERLKEERAVADQVASRGARSALRDGPASPGRTSRAGGDHHRRAARRGRGTGGTHLPVGGLLGPAGAPGPGAAAGAAPRPHHPRGGGRHRGRRSRREGDQLESRGGATAGLQRGRDDWEGPGRGRGPHRAAGAAGGAGPGRGAGARGPRRVAERARRADAGGGVGRAAGRRRRPGRRGPGRPRSVGAAEARPPARPLREAGPGGEPRGRSGSRESVPRST